ncbi:tRNA-splicing endonuclease subunit protein [Rutstroemia sp. NJR-2017a BBW]|nr:tRNA-splicing endonuclease subunit protein [Rutstroemia sp. NJR-2017a BBW]
MPSAAPILPPSSALQRILDSQLSDSSEPIHPPYLLHLAAVVLHNLQYQHDWTSLTIHTHSTLTNLPLPRPIVSGLPPKRAYIHPDEQVEILKAEHDTGESIMQVPELEWVLPTHLEEKWSLAQFSSIFDALETVPSGEGVEKIDESAVGARWQGKNRQKRILLATLHDDSTVVYYIMHDGIVKPRQN